MASPPARGVARARVEFVIDGAKVKVEVERRPLPHGGSQGFWICSGCGKLRYHLYVLCGVLACRVCHGLDYRSRHVLNRAVIRAAKLRQRLGAQAGLLSKLPPRPQHNKKAERYDRLVRALAAEEATLARLLGATVTALKRRKARLDGQRQ